MSKITTYGVGDSQQAILKEEAVAEITIDRNGTTTATPAPGTTFGKVKIVTEVPGGEGGAGAGVDEETVKEIVDEYLSENPPTVSEKDPTVPAWAKQPNKPSYSASEVGAAPADHNHDNAYDGKGAAAQALTDANKYTDDLLAAFDEGFTVALMQLAEGLYGENYWAVYQETGEFVPIEEILQAGVKAHNINEQAHSDIRELISGITTRLNALADSDDITLDQLSEIVAYIKANKSLIDSITTSKVSVSDIVNSLTSNATNKPLSAAQGAVLKGLIDAIKVPTKLSELSGDSTHRTVTDAEKSAWDGKSNFSGSYNDLTGKPTIPTVPTNVSAFNNDVGYLKSTQLTEAVNTALAQARESGEFDGADGERGSKILKVTTASTSYTTTVGDFKPSYRWSLATVLSESGAENVKVGDVIWRSYYHYPVGYVDSSYVYTGAYVSIRGATGSAGKTPVKGTDYFTEDDKTEMVNTVIAALPTTEGVGF